MKLSGKFICATREMCDFENHVPAPYFRRTFQLDFIPDHAELTICGLGLYELTVNGVDITKGPLAPYISNTDEVCYYDSYQLLPYLREGENVLGVTLGNGFRNPFGGFVWRFDQSPHRGPVCLALCFEARGRDGTLCFEADERFLTHPSPITFDDLRMGCRYDARQELPGWDTVGFDDSGWTPALPCDTPRGEARLCTAEPIAVCRELAPVAVSYHEEAPFLHASTAPDAEPIASSVRKNVHVVDFGINTAGVSRLHIKNARPGQVISIRHGEHPVGDDFDQRTTMFFGTDRTPRYSEYGQRDIYICRGGDESFTPKFKYDGFRYAFVEGVDPEQWAEDTLTLLVMNSDLSARATFRCSDPRLDRLQELTLRSDLANFYYFPTDCPHREKNGWTGDVSFSAEHLMLNLVAEQSLAEWLRCVALAQDAQGRIPAVIPTGGWGYDKLNGPAWDAVCVNTPYEIYRITGDASVILDNAEMIDRYLHYAASRRDERGLVAYGLGDWMDPHRAVTGQFASPLCFTDSAQIYDISRKAAQLFAQVELTDKRDYAEGLAAEMRSAIRTHLMDERLVVAGDCQTSQAMAIAMGLFDPEELAEAGRRLLDIIHRNGDVTYCGAQGIRYIFHALCQLGEIDLAHELLVCEQPTCYGHWLAHGATSLWESFKAFDAPNVDSRNHHFLGDISSFFIKDIVGLRPNPDLENRDSVEICPHLPKAMSFAEASVTLYGGTVSCRVAREGDALRYTIDLPEGMVGRLVTAEGTVPLKNGRHTY